MTDPTETVVMFFDGKPDLETERKEFVKTAAIERGPHNLLPTGYLSNSQVGMYLRCGVSYRFRYVDGLVAPPGINMVEGRAIHRGVEVGLNELRKTKKVGPLDVMLDAWFDCWKEEKKEAVWTEDSPVLGEKIIENRARVLLTSYQHDHMPKITPEGVERRFWASIGPYNFKIPVVGFIDLLDGTPVSEEAPHPTVVDHKVVASAKSQTEADNDMQLTLYSLVSKTPNVRFDSFCKTKIPKIVQMNSTRKPKDYEWMISVYTNVAKSILAGVFMPCDPTSWACSEKWCGYFSQCRGSK